VQIVDRRAVAAVLAIDEIIHHARLQRTGAEQRHQRDDVLEAVRCRRRTRSFMPRDSSWNNRRSRTGFEQREGCRIVHRKGAKLERGSTACARPAFTVAMAQSRIVSVRSPRKSNLTRPAASTSVLSNW